MKIVVFGASGMVGSAFCKAAVRRGLEVEAFSNRHAIEVDGLVATERLDLSKVEDIERPLLDRWPDCIVNAAAFSEPERVVEDPEAAEVINVALPRRLAEISNHLGARFIHLSTDLVFDGSEPPYRSTDMPNPLSLYGQQKLKAEKEVLAKCSDNFIVLRITIVNGNSPSGHRSVHEKLLRAISQNDTPTLFEDEYRQPCSCQNVAHLLVELCERPNLNGLFHWGGTEHLSRYEMGRRILERFGFPDDMVIAGSRLDFSGADQRPADLAFHLNPLDSKIKTRPASFDEQLEEMAIPDDLYDWFSEHSLDTSRYLRTFSTQ